MYRNRKLSMNQNFHGLKFKSLHSSRTKIIDSMRMKGMIAIGLGNIAKYKRSRSITTPTRNIVLLSESLYILINNFYSLHKVISLSTKINS